jgi:hypothetical protein
MVDNLYMRMKHLELHKNENDFFIKINSLVGRLSLFVDHPSYKLKEALDLKNKVHKTSGQLSLVPMKTKNMYVLEDIDTKGNKTQNFIYVSDEISSEMKIQSSRTWVIDHTIDFLSRSISVVYLLLYLVYFYFFMRYYSTMQTLYVLRFITGVLTLAFAVAYYYLRSSKTKSSFLKFCFKTELVLFIVSGSIANFWYLYSTPDPFFNNAMGSF